jgi:hypothetical protein
LGYNFDNLATLTGAAVSGQMGLGYRVAGGVRQLVMALDGVSGPESDQVWSGVFRYTQISGDGGEFSFVTQADLVAPGAAGGFERGTDGIQETARISVAWQREQGARTVGLMCGGTTGEGECMRLVQCWSGSDAAVAYEEVGRDDGSDIAWEETSCADPPIEPEPVSDSVLTVPNTDSDTGAPADEPTPMPEEGE